MLLRACNHRAAAGSKLVHGGDAAGATAFQEAVVYAFVVLVTLGLALGVATEVLSELLPVRTPKALTRTVGAIIAGIVAWALDYSVFSSFGQELREEWMHPVFSGLVLIAVGEATRELVTGISGRMGSNRTAAA